MALTVAKYGFCFGLGAFLGCIFWKNQVAGYFHSFLVYVHVGFIGFLWFLDGDFADYSVGGLGTVWGRDICCFIL